MRSVKARVFVAVASALSFLAGQRAADALSRVMLYGHGEPPGPPLADDPGPVRCTPEEATHVQ